MTWLIGSFLFAKDTCGTRESFGEGYRYPLLRKWISAERRNVLDNFLDNCGWGGGGGVRRVLKKGVPFLNENDYSGEVNIFSDSRAAMWALLGHFFNPFSTDVFTSDKKD